MCPCSAPQPVSAVGRVDASYLQRLSLVGLVGMAAGAIVTQKRYDWAAPGLLLGGALALGVGYVVLPRA